MIKLQPEAVALLRRVQDKIRESPTSFDMGVSQATEEDGHIAASIRLIGTLIPPCGTTACIAGWVDIFTRNKRRHARGIIKNAARKLGLSHEDSFGGTHRVLFFTDSWPEPFRSEDHQLRVQLVYTRTTSAQARKLIKGRGQVAIRRINHLINKGE